MPVCQQYGLGVFTWSPLAAGWLSGEFGETKANTSIRSGMFPRRYNLSLPGNQERLAIVTQLERLAAESGLSLIELSLAFVLSHPAVSCPIIGPYSLSHLESALAAATITLEDDVLDRIDEIVPPGRHIGPDLPSAPPAIADKSLRRR